MRLGTTEIILIVVLALVLFGGSKLAGVGKALGTALRTSRRPLRTTRSPPRKTKRRKRPRISRLEAYPRKERG